MTPNPDQIRSAAEYVDRLARWRATPLGQAYQELKWNHRRVIDAEAELHAARRAEAAASMILRLTAAKAPEQAAELDAIRAWDTAQ